MNTCEANDGMGADIPFPPFRPPPAATPQSSRKRHGGWTKLVTKEKERGCGLFDRPRTWRWKEAIRKVKGGLTPSFPQYKNDHPFAPKEEERRRRKNLFSSITDFTLNTHYSWLKYPIYTYIYINLLLKVSFIICHLAYALSISHACLYQAPPKTYLKPKVRSGWFQLFVQSFLF